MKNNDFAFFTDSTCDLPYEMYQQYNANLLRLTYEVDGEEYDDYSGLSFEEFYIKMREGKPTKTSQITPSTIEKAFEPFASEGKDILYIAFSSGLSGTFNSARIATENLSVKYPNIKIRIIDSLCASLGEGLLVYKAMNMYKDGKSLDEIANWVEENKLHLCHMFTVDDLMFLHRGGRVSKTSAIAGSILGIKPGMYVDNDGHLIPIAKIRGRKQSLNWLVENMEKRVGDYKNDVFAICHGDCIEDAKYVEKLVKDKFGIKKCIIHHTGAVIGAHSGPGTLALFFLGEHR